MRSAFIRHAAIIGIAAGTLTSLAAAQTKGVTHGVRPPRLVIRNAMIVDGNGTPARGPVDIVLDGNRISQIVPLDPVALRRGDARRPAGDAQIDATGKYVIPGGIDAHVHMELPFGPADDVMVSSDTFATPCKCTTYGPV